MSLIQEALAKTQKPISAPVKTAPQKPKTDYRPGSLESLDQFDREIEKKIDEVQSVSPKVIRKSYWPTVLGLVIGGLIVFGLIYWFSQRPAVEPAPLAVVDIQRSTFVNKPELAQAPITTEFVTLAESSDARGRFELSGIAWGGDQPYALINGQIMRVGDKVERKVFVQKIQKDYVDLDYRGELIRLELPR